MQAKETEKVTIGPNYLINSSSIALILQEDEDSITSYMYVLTLLISLFSYQILF